MLTHHISMHHELCQNCSICQRSFRKPFDLKKQMLVHDIHDYKIPYWCQQCNVGFAQKNQLKSHKKKVKKK